MKTVTIQVNDNIYELIKLAAGGHSRNLSNFIQFATMQYLTSSQYVDNEEMQEIMDDKKLIQNLMKGLKEFKKGEYTIV